MKITIYTTPTCPNCQMAKEYFSSKKLPFEDINVSRDQKKAEEMVKLSGQMGVPVIVIERQGLPAGRQVIIGFDEKEIEKVL